MAMKTLITNELFLDFIECRYRGYLKITGATEPQSGLLDVSGRLRERYHSQARERLLRAYSDKANQVCTDVGLSVVLANRFDLAIDVTATDANASVRFDALMAAPANARGSQPHYIPIIFVNNEKISTEDELQLALCASTLIRWHACRPSFGRILYGSDFRIRKVKLARALEKADRALEEIRALAERPSQPPLLRLNTHCPTCVFRTNCRATAIEKDDLSLLRGIKEKEIVKLRNKGIFTVTQLSYTFRPRKKSSDPTPESSSTTMLSRPLRFGKSGSMSLESRSWPSRALPYTLTSKERPIMTPTISLVLEFQVPPPSFNDLFGRTSARTKRRSGRTFFKSSQTSRIPS